MENIDTGISLLFNLFSIITYIYDVAMDIVLAAAHYTDGNYQYFALTLGFIIVPSVLMTWFSLRFYLNDEKVFANLNLPRATRTDWIIRSIFLILQSGPILRYIDSLRYGIKSLQVESDKAHYRKKMICELNDASFLRLIECFMEAGPQQILQIYIIARSGELRFSALTMTERKQLISIGSSLLSMAWALAAYQRTLRNSLSEKLPLSRLGCLVMSIWHLFNIGARVLALGLFASVLPVYVIIVFAAHIGAMFAWILKMKTSFCKTRGEEFLYNLALAAVFLFCYLNPKDTPTQRRYTIYYAVIFLENSVFMTVWYVCSSAVSYKLPAMLLQFLSFPIGIIFMVMYYLLLHPTGNIHVFQQNQNPELREQNGGCVMEVHVGSVCGLETAV